MKILLIGPFPLPIDGCSFANQTLYKNFEKHDADCDFINTNTPIVSSAQGNKFSLKKAMSFFPVYFNNSKIRKADVVYLTPGQTFFGIMKYSPFILLCKMYKNPYVIHLHGNYLGQQYEELTGLKKKLFKFMISGAAGGIVLSKSLRKNFEKLLPTDKVFVAENFVTEDIYEMEPQKQTDKLRIIYLSNLMREKGILEILQAALEIDKNGIPFLLTIAGKIEAALEDKVKEYFARLGDKVQYLGTVTGHKKRQALVDANIFVLPTYYKMEGQPISLLEGLATGNIIITTQHAGIPDIISDKNGYLVTPKSSEEIATVLADINKDIPAAVAKFSKNNVSYAAESFNEDRFYKNVFSVLKKVSAKN